MLQSATIQKRQSEIRQQLAGLAGTSKLTDEQRSQMTALDSEYSDNELKYRSALIAEDEQRTAAGKELETRSGSEWQNLVQGFELRQVALHMDEGRPLAGQTAEVVQEMRGKGGYRGVPVPFEALEVRVGETVSTDLPNPVTVAPVLDRLFAQSVASQMGTRFINIPSGSMSYPVVTDGVTVGWAATELGAVGGPAAFKASGNTLSPDHTLGAMMKISRKSLLQTAGLESAIRRDMGNAIQQELDRAIFLGSGASGEPNGVIADASGYGINEFTTSKSAKWAEFKAQIVEFIKNNAAAGPGAVNVLIRPEIWAYMDGTVFDVGSGITEWDRLVSRVANVVQTSNALAAPVTNESKVLFTTGQPIYCGLWGGIDLIRDPYSDATSGGLRLTGLITCDVTITRAVQLRVATKFKDV